MSLTTIVERLRTDQAPAGARRERLVLPFSARSRSRVRARLESGEEVGVVLERGTQMRNGDLLRMPDARVVEIVAAPEEVSIVLADDPWQLARAAYHLGNRHVALQVGNGWLRFLHDHVLDDMLIGMGFTVSFARMPFEPEAGAYAPGSHTHHHDHTHGHSHHAHDHDDQHGH